MHEDDKKAILRAATISGLRTRLGNHIHAIEQLNICAKDNSQFINDSLPKIEKLLEAIGRTVALINEYKEK